MADAKKKLLAGRYAAEQIIGEGAGGVVAAAKDIQNNSKKVAVKRICEALETYSNATYVLRELKFLRLLRGHDNIVELKDVLIPSDLERFNDTYAVFELLPCDLSRFLQSPAALSAHQVCCLMFQLLRGVRYMHNSGVLHRDLQPSNILVDRDCRLKICDFGLARAAFRTENDSDLMMWTNYVAARRYRAPELIVPHTKRYGRAIDVWSVGCIFAELLLRRPLFHGENSRDQLQRIIQFTGKPDLSTILKLESKQAQKVLSKMPDRGLIDLKSFFPKGTDEAALRLISQMLQFDPDKRITAREALMNQYFDDWRRKLGFGKPACVMTEDEFEFEKRLESNDRDKDSLMYIRRALLEEIALYHPEKRKELVGTPEEYNSVVLVSPKRAPPRAIDHLGAVP